MQGMDDRQSLNRLAIVNILSKYLNHCLEICQKGASSVNIEQYAITLASAHVTEVMPQIRNLYKQIDINHVEVDGITDIEGDHE